MAVTETVDIDAPPIVTKIGLVGFTASREDAPWGDPSWQIYGCNNLHMYLNTPKHQFAGWFDLHEVETIRKDEEHQKWLTQTDIPVYTWSPQPEWPTAHLYPKDDVLELFAHLRGGKYFTNSISWMVAWGIMQLRPAIEAGLPTELGVWGVDMAQSTEYAAQRPSCEYWIGIAEALGITVVLPLNSDLLKSVGMYGIVEDSDLRRRLVSRSKELDEQMSTVQAQERAMLEQLTEMRNHMHQIVGAKESNDYILGVWMQPEGTREGADPVIAASDGQSAIPPPQEA